MDSTRKKTGPLDVEQCVAKNMTFASTLKSKFIKVFVGIIKSLNFVAETEIELTDNGLKYIVEESKSFQVTAYIMHTFFTTFLFKPPKGTVIISFGVKLNSLTDLLSAFIDNDLGNMNITYFHNENLIVFSCTQVDSGETKTKKVKRPINIDEEASEIKTDYYLRTMNSIEPIDFECTDKIASDLIIEASVLLDVLNDFDRSNEELRVKITLDKLQLRSCRGLSAVAKLHANTDAFDKFNCKETTRFAYKFAHFRVLAKGLPFARKASLRTFVNGLLRIQLRVKVEDEESAAFIEYNMMPNVDEESDQDD